MEFLNFPFWINCLAKGITRNKGMCSCAGYKAERYKDDPGRGRVSAESSTSKVAWGHGVHTPKANLV